MKTMFQKENSTLGISLVLVIVLSAVFLTILTAFITYISTQSKVITQRYNMEQAAEVAEAGLNYFKWYLHHNTDDIVSALPADGSTTSVYTNISGDDIGEFSLEISTTTYCGAISSINVRSTGRTYQDPSLTRTVSARFMRPTVANYSYILDAPYVHAGEDREIYGPYHSNGGVRMDGTNYSTVSSELATYGSENGVWTEANGNESLFVFPTLEIPFSGFVNDLDDIETLALNNGGYHKDPSPDGHGYLVEFIGGGQLRVTDVRRTRSYSAGLIPNSSPSVSEDNIIRDLRSSTEEIWTINEECPVAFFDDRVWLQEGDDAPYADLDEMITIVSRDDIILQGDITYADPEEDGLLAIAEGYVLVGVEVPNNMELNGIFVAQTGSFGRNYYRSYNLPSGYGGYETRNELVINGTIVSKGQVGTKWGSVSGFMNRENYYNRDLVDNPPPLVPNTSSNYSLYDWREED